MYDNWAPDHSYKVPEKFSYLQPFNRHFLKFGRFIDTLCSHDERAHRYDGEVERICNVYLLRGRGNHGLIIPARRDIAQLLPPGMSGELQPGLFPLERLVELDGVMIGLDDPHRFINVPLEDQWTLHAWADTLRHRMQQHARGSVEFYPITELLTEEISRRESSVEQALLTTHGSHHSCEREIRTGNS